MGNHHGPVVDPRYCCTTYPGQDHAPMCMVRRAAGRPRQGEGPATVEVVIKISVPAGAYLNVEGLVNITRGSVSPFIPYPHTIVGAVTEKEKSNE